MEAVKVRVERSVMVLEILSAIARWFLDQERVFGPRVRSVRSSWVACCASSRFVLRGPGRGVE